jgi:hypothetical protein
MPVQGPRALSTGRFLLQGLRPRTPEQERENHLIRGIEFQLKFKEMFI